MQIRLFSPKTNMTISKIDKPDAYGRTELHLAAFGMQPNAAEKVKALIAAGHDPNFSDSFGQTPFHMACYGFADLNLVKNFLDSKPSLDQKSLWERSFLHYAANGAHVDVNKNLDILPMLLDHYKNSKKVSSIETDEKKKEAFVKKAFIELINQADKDGLTPLHLVCMPGCSKTTIEGRVATVKLLLSEGAIPKNDSLGRSPADLAEYYNFKELKEIFEPTLNNILKK
jgi:ankyrin repeat protein